MTYDILILLLRGGGLEKVQKVAFYCKDDIPEIDIL